MRYVTVMCLGATFLAPALAQDAAAPRYTLKQEQPNTGSHLPREVVTSGVPVDKAYHELSPSEQSVIKSQYEAMGPRDEPPYPAAGPKNLYRAVAAIQQKFLVKGQLTLFVDVDSQGVATAVSVLASPDPEFAKTVAQVLMIEKYKPALCDGVPCAMQFPFRADLKVRR